MRTSCYLGRPLQLLHAHSEDPAKYHCHDSDQLLQQVNIGHVSLIVSLSALIKITAHVGQKARLIEVLKKEFYTTSAYNEPFLSDSRLGHLYSRSTFKMTNLLNGTTVFTKKHSHSPCCKAVKRKETYEERPVRTKNELGWLPEVSRHHKHNSHFFTGLLGHWLYNYFLSLSPSFSFVAPYTADSNLLQIAYHNLVY